MGDNPTSSQGVPALLDLTTSNILLGANQMPSGSMRILDYKDTFVTYNNSTAETLLASYLIPKNTLGIKGMLQYTAFITMMNLGASTAFNLNAYFNGVKIVNNNANQLVGSNTCLNIVDIRVKNLGSASSQLFVFQNNRNLTGSTLGTPPVLAATDSVYLGGALLSVDTANNDVLVEIKGTIAAASASFGMSCYSAIAQLWQP